MKISIYHMYIFIYSLFIFMGRGEPISLSLYVFILYIYGVIIYVVIIYILLFTSWLFIIILYNYIVIHIVFICALIYTLRYINDRPYRHPRRGRPYRIEDRLWSFFSSRGLCWRTVALNPGWFDSFEMEFCRQGSQG